MTDYLTVTEAAVTLRVTPQTVYDWARRGIIATSRPGGARGKILIPRAAVEARLTPEANHER